MTSPVVSILTVDDYEPARYAHARALRAEGFQVLEAKDGRSALEMAARERPDLLLLDVHLPDLHGFEVCQQLKADARTADIPIIHVSATGRGDRYRRESAAVGAFAYLQEPVAPAELLRVVRLALEAAGKLRRASADLRPRAAGAREKANSIGTSARKAPRRAASSAVGHPRKRSG